MSKRIAILGGGPSGLAVLRAFESARRKGAEIPEIVCYEKQSDCGGMWNYNWRTGLDEFGEPVHASMYRYLWSNGPKECLEFADYSFEEHFGRPIPSFPPRAVLHDYIKGRIEKSNVRGYIKLNHAVRHVTYDAGTEKFLVTVKDLKADVLETSAFDYVVCATGHFSTPNVPYFEGVEAFPGRVLHAHDFRSADEFAGKNVLLIGASYSSEDIGIQCMKYGAKSVTFSYRTKAMGFDWPEGFSEVPLLEKVVGKVAHFKDGTRKEVDAIVLCTGYLHHYPFLDDDLRLKSRNRLYPEGLYKGIFWVPNPRFMYIGAQDQFFTFNMFDAQAWYARDVVSAAFRCPMPPPWRPTSRAGWQGRSARRRLADDRLPDRICARTDPRHRLSAPRRGRGGPHVQGVGAPQGREHPHLSRPQPPLDPHRHAGAQAPYAMDAGAGRQPGSLPRHHAQPGRGMNSAGLSMAQAAAPVFTTGAPPRSRPALAPGVERYVVAGGGAQVFTLEPGDRIEIAQLEGGQPVELLAFDAAGRPATEALGLAGQGRAEGLLRILASGAPDAERVRFGLFRRQIDPAAGHAARLFGPDAVAGQSVLLVAERMLHVIVAAPAEAMLVWEQNPATDLLVFLTRAVLRRGADARLPEPLAEPRLDLRINVASAISFEVFEGETIQIIDIEGRQCSDFIAFGRRRWTRAASSASTPPPPAP